jgi:uncharacterized membrane protein YheB (UPF0754 family)
MEISGVKLNLPGIKQEKMQKRFTLIQLIFIHLSIYLWQKILVNYAKQLKNNEITKEKYDSLTTKLFPKDFNKDLQNTIAYCSVKYIKNNLSADDKLVKDLIGEKSIEKAAREMIANPTLLSKEKLLSLTDEGYEAF